MIRLFQAITSVLEAIPSVKGRVLPPLEEVHTMNGSAIASLFSFTSSGLGLTSGKKAIKPGYEYEAFWNKESLKGTSIKIATGSNFRTLDEMERIVKETLSQTARLARKLKGRSTEDTLKNVFAFFNEHYQYKEDHKRKEELREPVRAWKDRITGIDCDCFAISISSVLTHLDIPHAFRMTRYNGRPDFQHVYVVANAGGRSIALDPVAGRFNYEVPYTGKYDKTIRS